MSEPKLPDGRALSIQRHARIEHLVNLLISSTRDFHSMDAQDFGQNVVTMARWVDKELADAGIAPSQA